MRVSFSRSRDGTHFMDNRNIVLKSSFKAHTDGLNFAHLNTGSLLTHLDELRLIVKDVPLHVICISETRLFPEKHADNSISISGFDIVRKDRSNRIGGGVAIYIRKGLKYKIIEQNSLESVFDLLFIELTNVDGDKIAVGVMYIPPRIKFINSIRKCFNRLMKSYTDVIILGDFNLNLLSDGSNVNRFKELLLNYGLSSASLNEPTNFMGDSATLIDLALLKSLSKLVFYTQISVACATTHDLIYGSYDFWLSDFSRKPEFTFMRNFKQIDIEELNCYASSLDWSSIYYLLDLNDKLQSFNDLILHVLHKFAPLKGVKFKHNLCEQWLTKEIQWCINRKNYLHNCWRQSRRVEDRDKFREYRNWVNNLIRKSKAVAFSKIFNVNQSPKILWRNLNQFGVTKTSKPTLQYEPSEFSKVFSSVFNNSNANRIAFNNVDSSATFYFQNIDQGTVLKFITSITSTATGSDEIPLQIITKLSPTILSHLTYILNCCLTKSIFPDIWKVANIVPVNKTNYPKNINEFRPISILPCMSKVLEKLMKTQIVNHLTESRLLNDFQSGFREGFSTTTALAHVVDDLAENVELGKVSILVCLDFAKAFDTVDHNILLNKLSSQFNFSISAVSFLESYLKSRRQRVIVNGRMSDEIVITSGVPQGSILGPILFSMFINDISSSLNSVKFHVFADDFQLYDAGFPDTFGSCVFRINQALDTISDWAICNNIKINPAKSKALIINKLRKFMPVNIDLLISGYKIEIVEKIKSLGLLINNKLSWEDHINMACGRIYGILARLRVTANLAPILTKIKIVKALVFPQITYCAPIFSGASKTILNKLNVALNSCVRFIFCKKLGEPITALTKSIVGCHLYNYLDYFVSVFMYKIISTKQPSYLYNKLKFSKSSRTLNLNLPIKCKTTVRQSSLLVHGVKTWNRLHPTIKSSPTVNAFKKQSFSFFSIL